MTSPAEARSPRYPRHMSDVTPATIRTGVVTSFSGKTNANNSPTSANLAANRRPQDPSRARAAGNLNQCAPTRCRARDVRRKIRCRVCLHDDQHLALFGGLRGGMCSEHVQEGHESAGKKTLEGCLGPGGGKPQGQKCTHPGGGEFRPNRKHDERFSMGLQEQAGSRQKGRLLVLGWEQVPAVDRGRTSAPLVADLRHYSSARYTWRFSIRGNGDGTRGFWRQQSSYGNATSRNLARPSSEFKLLRAHCRQTSGKSVQRPLRRNPAYTCTLTAAISSLEVPKEYGRVPDIFMQKMTGHSSMNDMEYMLLMLSLGITCDREVRVVTTNLKNISHVQRKETAW